MDKGLLDYLVNNLASHTEKQYQFTPGAKTDPNRYYGNIGPKAGTLESMFLDMTHGDSAAGATNAFTGGMWFYPNLHKNNLDESLGTMFHENFHSNRTGVPIAGKVALRNRSIDMFGGEEEYDKFLDKIRSDLNLDMFTGYSVQHAMPVIGKYMKEEEILAHLMGSSGAKNSLAEFKAAINKMHPKAGEWFDMQTNMLDMIR